MFNLGLALSFAVMVSFAISDTLAKKVSTVLGNKKTTFVMFAASFIPLLVGAGLIGLTKISLIIVLLSAASGILYALAYLLVYKALETQQVSNTNSLLGIEYMITALFSVLLLGESVTVVEVLCFLGIFLGGFLATTDKKFKFNKGYIPAILAYVVVGLSYLPLAFAQRYSGGPFSPILISRFAAFLGVVLYLWLIPERNKKFAKVKLSKTSPLILGTNVLMGILTGFASLGFLVLAAINYLAIGSAIAATESVLVISFGYLFYKERFAGHQVIGFVILVISAVILSVL